MESPNSPTTSQPQVQSTITTPIVTSSVGGAAVVSGGGVVAIPVPVVQPIEGTYMYAFIKGSLYANFTSLFGLTSEEIQALSKRYGNAATGIDNGIMIKSSPPELINALAQLGYKVICSTGEAEVTWTMQREA